jgi:hypothetical protein
MNARRAIFLSIGAWFVGSLLGLALLVAGRHSVYEQPHQVTSAPIPEYSGCGTNLRDVGPCASPAPGTTTGGVR